MNESENWFAKSMTTLLGLLVAMGSLVALALLTGGELQETDTFQQARLHLAQRAAASDVIESPDRPRFDTGHVSRGTKETEFFQAAHEIAKRLAIQPADSPYHLVPRAAGIAHETSVDESGNAKRVTRASVNFNPGSHVQYTVLVWQDVETEIDGEPVEMRIFYDAVPGGAPLAR